VRRSQRDSLLPVQILGKDRGRQMFPEPSQGHGSVALPAALTKTSTDTLT